MPKPLVVFAAASTSEPLTSLAKDFEAKSGTRVRIALGASSDLARQIKAGAPADLFLSADERQMDALDAEGLIDRSSRRALLSNQLVVAVPEGDSTTFRGPGDLLRARRIALADPAAVPAGVYARQWLESAGLWTAIAPKVIPSLDVRAALSAVDRGAVDAAVVYRTDVAVAKHSRIAFEVPAPASPQIIYPVAKVARSSHPAARTFLELLMSDQAKLTFSNAGFIVLARSTSTAAPDGSLR